MTGFGDADPDDAYDAGDPPADQLSVLALIADDVARGPASYRNRVRILFVVAAGCESSTG